MNAIIVTEPQANLLRDVLEARTPPETVVSLVVRTALANVTPGTPVFVREPWRIHQYGWATQIDYRYGGTRDLGPDGVKAEPWITRHGAWLDFEGANPKFFNLAWMQASRMPAWAARYHLSIRSAEAVQDTPGFVRLTAVTFCPRSTNAK